MITPMMKLRPLPAVEWLEVAAVIVNYRTPALTLECVEALAKERAYLPQLQAIVVDGGSNDHSVDSLRQGLSKPHLSQWVSLLPLDFNGGFGWANNQALLRLMQRNLAPEFVYLLNPDARVEQGAVAHLAHVLATHPGCAAVGSQLIDPKGGPAGSAFRFPSIGRELIRGADTPALGRLFRITPVLIPPGRAAMVDWVTGASVMLRTAALREVGLFDDGFFLYFEEIELMHRLRRAGWEVRHVPESRVLHIGGAATGVNGHDPELMERRPPYWYHSRRRFFTRAYGRVPATLAGLAWLAGRVVWRGRRALGLGGRKVEVPLERCDLLSHGLVPDRTDQKAAVVHWHDSPGLMPAWVRYQEQRSTHNASPQAVAHAQEYPRR